MSGIIDLTSDDEGNPELRPPINVEAVSDEEDEDLKLAIALSLQDQTNAGGTDVVLSQGDVPSEPVIAHSTSSSAQNGLLGLDRKAMEAERLARLKRKREPDTNPQPALQPSLKSSSMSTSISPPPPRRQKPTSSLSSTTLSSSSTIKSSDPPSFSAPQVLLTSEPSRRDPTDLSKYTSISFADIVKPPSSNLQLKSTLLSSFIADFDWILPHFNTRTVNFLLLLHAQNAQHRALLENDFAGLQNVKLVIPEVMGGAGNMHSKIMLLFFQSVASQCSSSSGDKEEICRVVIPSANLTRADWGVGGVMENILFVVDLPLKNGTDDTVYRFEKKLRTQLAAMDVPDSVLRKLDKFDFAATRNTDFVYSKSGSHLLDVSSTKAATTTSGANSFFQQARGIRLNGETSKSLNDRPSLLQHGVDDPARTGLLSLNDAVVSLGLEVSSDDPNELPQVDFITSSLGNLTTDFVRQLYLAICGRLDPAKIVGKQKHPGTKPADIDMNLDEKILQNLRIYFPSSETVQRSKGGPGAGGTICFQRKWWEANGLIRQCLHDCVGVRGDGILMHSKILYVRFKTPKASHGRDSADRLYLGWAYIGSANLSESAWGRVVSDVKSKQPKLTCRNWESGVLLPMEVKNAQQTEGAEDNTVAGSQSSSERGNTQRVEDVDSKAKPETTARTMSYLAHTSADKVVTQVQVGKQGFAARSKPDGSGEGSNAYDRNKKEGAKGAAMQQEVVDKSRKLASLVDVFSGVVPVPLGLPASSHIARQQTPWFFME